jgi:hypothetical protein
MTGTRSCILHSSIIRSTMGGHYDIITAEIYIPIVNAFQQIYSQLCSENKNFIAYA